MWGIGWPEVGTFPKSRVVAGGFVLPPSLSPSRRVSRPGLVRNWECQSSWCAEIHGDHGAAHDRPVCPRPQENQSDAEPMTRREYSPSPRFRELEQGQHLRPLANRQPGVRHLAGCHNRSSSVLLRWKPSTTGRISIKAAQLALNPRGGARLQTPSAFDATLVLCPTNGKMGWSGDPAYRRPAELRAKQITTRQSVPPEGGT